ncbi:hypothetical protein HRbin04_00294 [archaeon HR04]|nr:hypothetical protein HRbin04_00294 [archaeon HR04]
MVQRKVEEEEEGVRVGKDKNKIKYKSIEQILKIEERDDMLEQLVLYAVRNNNCSKVKDIVDLLMSNDLIKTRLSSPSSSTIDDILDAVRRLAHKKAIMLYNSSITSFKDYLKNMYLSMTLWITAIVTAVTILTIYVLPDAIPWSIVRIVVGGAFVLFIPGYALVQLLFPSREMDVIERVALSIGLSLAVVPLTGFLLNYSPWGIRLDPIVASVSALSIILAFASVYRAYMMNVKTVRGEEEDED